MFQSSHGDERAGPPVQVLSRLQVLFVSVQHRDPDALGAKDVTLEEPVPLGNDVAVIVGWMSVPLFELAVPSGGEDDAVGCELVTLLLAVPLGKGADVAVSIGPMALPLLVDELALQQPVLEIQMELVMVDVTR